MSMHEERKNSQGEKPLLEMTQSEGQSAGKPGIMSDTSRVHKMKDHSPTVKTVYESPTEDALPIFPEELSVKKPVTMKESSKDPCLPQKKQEVVETKKSRTPGLDPRFQQQNQTMRCFVMYTDFYRCENILGEGTEACQWFKEVFTSICPNEWIRRWDDYKNEGRLPWSKSNTQGTFPGDRYGV